MGLEPAPGLPKPGTRPLDTAAPPTAASWVRGPGCQPYTCLQPRDSSQAGPGSASPTSSAPVLLYSSCLSSYGSEFHCVLCSALLCGDGGVAAAAVASGLTIS